MKTKPEDFQFFIDDIERLSPEERKTHLEKDHDQNDEEYRQFTETFSNGICYLCDEKLTRCDYEKPCIHWLFRKHKRIKKKHIYEALKTRGLFELIAFLRWAAASKGNLSHINDFEAYEERKGLYYHETIEFENIIWTFWIKDSDLTGHPGTHTDFPHYHIHMTIDGRSFIDFGDFHVPLSEWDIFNTHARRGAYPNFTFLTPYGETYSDLFKVLPDEKILGGMKKADDESQAQFHMETFIEAHEGKTLKGDDLADIIEEHNRTGVPLAKLVKRLDAKITTVVTPHNLVDPVLRDKSEKGR